MRALAVLSIFCFVSGCYRGTTSLAEAEGKGDAAFVGMRLDSSEGEAAADTLVRMAGRGVPEARVLLGNRLATMKPGPVRDRLDAGVRAGAAAGNANLIGLLGSLQADERAPYREAGSRIQSP